MAKPKKVLKIIAGVIVFFTLPTLLFFGFLYLKYDEDLPTGIKGEPAELLATKMLNALDHEAYKNTNYIEWTFNKRHHYKWNKAKNNCQVYWKSYRVDLDLNDPSKSEAFENEEKVDKESSKKLIEKAISNFNNDSFWLVAPYKVFDPGTERRIVTLEDGSEGLLVTYTSGGTTPGDSYLWHLDASGKPTSFQMWVDILPINGLKASWSDWRTTESGAQLPTFHKFMIFGFEITDLVGRK
ncbi:hypothetical protein [Gelidibacter pelagius]|uniref:Uncharacterized protein n=1 Tax=Gelidibacter pelagius TaxID=2819985 RepID=A0ABS3ST93_9FLAO|nr:hypothetical protein [Gelidibacter pelagius]MBO3098924.1 hypothetical protein [Gelidibacter pelagius]